MQEGIRNSSFAPGRGKNEEDGVREPTLRQTAQGKQEEQMPIVTRETCIRVDSFVAGPDDGESQRLTRLSSKPAEEDQLKASRQSEDPVNAVANQESKSE